MSDTIFSYEQLDGWDNLISKINIYNRDKNNIVCTMPHESVYNNIANEKPDEFTATLPKSEINKMIKIIESSGILELCEDNVEEPLMLDGYMNLFVFSNGLKLNEIYVSNIWYYRENKSVYAKQLLKTFDRITRILSNYGVDSKYFSLGYYDNKQ